MSRGGRAYDLLRDWRDHPRGCTADHGGWSGDGYEGPCTDDPDAILEELNMIDPFFLHDKIAELEKAAGAQPEGDAPG